MALSPQNAVGTEGNSVLRYLIDPKGSTFGVQAFSTGVLSAFGHSPKIAIRIFEGRVSFTVDGNVLRDVNLEVRINTNSLEVADDIGRCTTMSSRRIDFPQYSLSGPARQAATKTFFG